MNPILSIYNSVENTYTTTTIQRDTHIHLLLICIARWIKMKDKNRRRNEREKIKHVPCIHWGKFWARARIGKMYVIGIAFENTEKKSVCERVCGLVFKTSFIPTNSNKSTRKTWIVFNISLFVCVSLQCDDL